MRRLVLVLLIAGGLWGCAQPRWTSAKTSEVKVEGETIEVTELKFPDGTLEVRGFYWAWVVREPLRTKSYIMRALDQSYGSCSKLDVVERVPGVDYLVSYRCPSNEVGNVEAAGSRGGAQ